MSRKQMVTFILFSPSPSDNGRSAALHGVSYGIIEYDEAFAITWIQILLTEPYLQERFNIKNVARTYIIYKKVIYGVIYDTCYYGQ